MSALFLTGLALLGGFFALILLLCGALLMGAGLALQRRARASRSWPRVEATIEASEVVAERQFKGGQRYRVRVRYRYRAPGSEHVGGRLSFTDRLHSSERAARRVAEKYRMGSSVPAHYDPQDPDEAVLERGSFPGVPFLLFGLLCWAPPIAAALALGFPPSAIAAAIGLLLACVLAVRSRGSGVAEARKRGIYPPPGCGSDDDVVRLATRGERLLAIRLYRELHGVGLKEAREAVDAFTPEKRS